MAHHDPAVPEEPATTRPATQAEGTFVARKLRAAWGKTDAAAAERELATSVFEYVEAFYNPRRRHSSIGNLSPAEFETRHMAEADAA